MTYDIIMDQYFLGYILILFFGMYNINGKGTFQIDEKIL